MVFASAFQNLHLLQRYIEGALLLVTYGVLKTSQLYLSPLSGTPSD